MIGAAMVCSTLRTIELCQMFLAWRHWRLESTHVLRVCTYGSRTPSRWPSAVSVAAQNLFSLRHPIARADLQAFHLPRPAGRVTRSRLGRKGRGSLEVAQPDLVGRRDLVRSGRGQLLRA